MKILHLLVFPLFGSGSGTYVRKLAEKTALEFPDDEVAILCPDKSRAVKGVKIFTLELPFKVVFTGHPDWPDAKIYSQLTAEEIAKLMEYLTKSTIETILKFKPDVIHVHHASCFASIASFVKAIFHINYVVTIHGTCILCASQDKRWIPIVRPGLANSYMINAVSGDTKKWMAKIFGRKLLRKTKVITGGVDIEAYSKEGSTDLVDKKYKIKDKKVVIFSGKLTNKKGVEYLIKAAPKIKAEIFIIGGGEEKEKLENLAQKLKVKNVVFTGYKGKESIEEFRQFYRKADVFVFPSVWDEPLGLVALEAMASSTPVVASNKGGIPLAVKNNFNGFLVRARSSKEIAEKVNKILNNSELKNRLSKNARLTVEQKFSWRLISQKFHTMYDQAYDSSQKSRKAGRSVIDKEEIEREKTEIKGKRIGYI